MGFSPIHQTHTSSRTPHIPGETLFSYGVLPGYEYNFALYLTAIHLPKRHNTYRPTQIYQKKVWFYYLSRKKIRLLFAALHQQYFAFRQGLPARAGDLYNH